MKKSTLLLLLALAMPGMASARPKPQCQTRVAVQLANNDEESWFFGKGLKKFPAICMEDTQHPAQYLITVKKEQQTFQTRVWTPSSVSQTTVNSDTTVDAKSFSSTGATATISGNATTDGTATTVTKTRQTVTTSTIKGYAYVFRIGPDGKPENYPVFATTHSLGGWTATADVKALEKAVKFVSKQSQSKR